VVDPDRAVVAVYQVPDASGSCYLDLPAIEGTAFHDPRSQFMVKPVLTLGIHRRRRAPPHGGPGGESVARGVLAQRFPAARSFSLLEPNFPVIRTSRRRNSVPAFWAHSGTTGGGTGP
jgi:hypothetical protein